MLPELDQLLQYRHPQVLRAFVRAHGGDEARAHALFDDMLRFLWISRKHMLDREREPDDEALDFVFVMHEEMREVDNMWHNFLLYSRDYTEFCRKYFGEYLHHQPDIADGPPPPDGEFTAQMEKYLSYVYDNLGEETVRRWFAAQLSEVA